MQVISLFSLILVGFLISCQSSKNQTSSSDKEKASVEALTLEQVSANWQQSMQDMATREAAPKINWQEDLAKICGQQENLCEYGSRGSRKKDTYNRQVQNEIKKNIEQENFAELSQYSVPISLKFFGPFKDAKLLVYASHLLKDTSCQTLDMRHALGSAMEDFLPDVLVKSTILALYESNSECAMSRTVAQSSYRAAMLRLLDQDCAKAGPLLQKVSSSAEDYLKPRALYWSWKCQGQSTAYKKEIDSQLPFFSYHRILMEEALPPMPTPSKVLAESTPVRVDSQKSDALNEAARLAEKLMAAQMTSAARAVLERIRVERVFETEPEFQVYWAHLLHLNQAGIRKFQILSNLVNSNPTYRSRSVQNMLFPTWFFNHVEATSKTLDPWLIQALIRQESGFDPLARSRVGATGLMQLMPATARLVARTSKSQLKDPEMNVKAGVKFLEKLVEKFNGQIPMALAAYNAGPLRVEEWIKRYPTHDPMLFVDIIPYRETREYVAFILRNYYWYRSLNTPQTPQSQKILWDTRLKVALQSENSKTF